MPANIIAKEIFTHGSKNFNFAAYPHDFHKVHPYSFDAHWHEEWELIYVRDGIFRFYIDGQLFTVQKGQAVLVDRYAIHITSSYDIGSGSGYNCFVFGRRFLCPDSESYIYRRYFQETYLNDISLTQRFTGEKEYEREILRHLRNLDQYSARPEENALSIQISLLSIFEILLREHSYTLSPRKLDTQNELVKTALLYINQGYHDSLQIRDIAALLNISTDHLIRLFKAAVGITPKRYIQDLRMQEAISTMSLDPKLPISSVAQKAGFDDFNYFSRSFKKSTGLSPTQFVKTLKNCEI